MSAAGPLTSWVAAVLRAEDSAIRRLSSEPSSSFFEAADRDGVLCLVDRALRDSKWLDRMPAELREPLAAKVRCEQSVELVRREELRRTCAAFRAAGVPALVFKGAALAYLYYPFPHLRPRVDTDFLIRPEDRTRAVEALERIGYERTNMVTRDAIFTQWTFVKPGVGSTRHLLDLHWRITNRPLFRDLFSFAELDARAIEIPGIGPAARTPCTVHALILACVHPVAHHHSDWPLMWLYDISLLAERLDSTEWTEFRDLATTKRVSFICKRTFELASGYFGEGSWWHRSQVSAIPGKRQSEEPSAAYLDQEDNRRQDLMFDLRGTPGLSGKAMLLMAHAFPNMDYVREAYGASGWLAMTSAYARRFGNACLQLARSGRAGQTREVS